MIYCNSFFDYEKFFRELFGDILEWFKGDIIVWC